MSRRLNKPVLCSVLLLDHLIQAALKLFICERDTKFKPKTFRGDKLKLLLVLESQWKCLSLFISHRNRNDRLVLVLEIIWVVLNWSWKVIEKSLNLMFKVLCVALSSLVLTDGVPDLCLSVLMMFVSCRRITACRSISKEAAATQFCTERRWRSPSWVRKTLNSPIVRLDFKNKR